MFRSLMILGALGVIAFMAGWFTIHRDDNETTIRFNRDEIRADTSKAFAKGREILKGDQDDTGAAPPQAPGNWDAGTTSQPGYTSTPYQGNGYDNGSYPPPGYNSQPPNYSGDPPPQSASRPIPPWEKSR